MTKYCVDKINIHAYKKCELDLYLNKPTRDTWTSRENIDTDYSPV